MRPCDCFLSKPSHHLFRAFGAPSFHPPIFSFPCLTQLGLRCTEPDRDVRPPSGEVAALLLNMMQPDGGVSQFGARPDLLEYEGGASLECYICADAARDTVFKPCNHALACSACAAKLVGDACPLCRAPVSGIEAAAGPVTRTWQGPGPATLLAPQAQGSNGAGADAATVERLARLEKIERQKSALAALNTIPRYGDFRAKMGLLLDNAVPEANFDGLGLRDAHVAAVADALPSNTAATKLTMRKNDIGPEGVRALADALRREATLTALDLGDNKLGEEGVRALVDALDANPNSRLKGVKVDGCGASVLMLSELKGTINRVAISAKIKAVLTDTVGEACSLAGLGLTQAQATSLADALAANRSLTALDCRGCAFSAAGVSRLADCVRSGGVLRRLDLYGAGGPFFVGDAVVLTSDYEEHGAAKDGPLKPGDVGTVVKVDTPKGIYEIRPGVAAEGTLGAGVLLADFVGETVEELSVAEGTRVTVDYEADGWLLAHTANGKSGLVPRDYVQLRAPLPTVRAFASLFFIYLFSPGALPG